MAVAPKSEPSDGSPNFGSSQLEQAETALVIFQVSLLVGMILLGWLFVVMIRRNQRKLPPETRQLLQEMEDQGEEFGADVEKAGPKGAPEEPRDPWEQDPDWWKK